MESLQFLIGKLQGLVDNLSVEELKSAHSAFLLRNIYGSDINPDQVGDDIAQIRRAVKVGIQKSGLEEIKDAIPSLNSTIEDFVRQNDNAAPGIEGKRARYGNISIDKQSQMSKMRRSGKSVKDIAHEFNLSESTVRKYTDFALRPVPVVVTEPSIDQRVQSAVLSQHGAKILDFAKARDSEIIGGGDALKKYLESKGITVDISRLPPDQLIALVRSPGLMGESNDTGSISIDKMIKLVELKILSQSIGENKGTENNSITRLEQKIDSLEHKIIEEKLLRENELLREQLEKGPVDDLESLMGKMKRIREAVSPLVSQVNQSGFKNADGSTDWLAVAEKVGPVVMRTVESFGKKIPEMGEMTKTPMAPEVVVQEQPADEDHPVVTGDDMQDVENLYQFLLQNQHRLTEKDIAWLNWYKPRRVYVLSELLRREQAQQPRAKKTPEPVETSQHVESYSREDIIDQNADAETDIEEQPIESEGQEEEKHSEMVDRMRETEESTKRNLAGFY